MVVFAETEVVPLIVVGIGTAAIGAVATMVAAVLPVWLKLRHERLMRAEDIRKAEKQEGTLESDVDQLENQLLLSDERIKQLESKLAASEQIVKELRRQVAGHGAVTVPLPLPPPPPLAGPLSGRDKRAYLVGAEPRGSSVQWLVKVHDYKGKAIYVYDLLSGEAWKEADARTSDIDARILRYGEVGHPIDHPGNIRLDNTAEWVNHARLAAQKKELRIEKQGSGLTPRHNTPC